MVIKETLIKNYLLTSKIHTKLGNTPSTLRQSSGNKSKNGLPKNAAFLHQKLYVFLNLEEIASATS